MSAIYSEIAKDLQSKMDFCTVQAVQETMFKNKVGSSESLQGEFITSQEFSPYLKDWEKLMPRGKGNMKVPNLTWMEEDI